MLKHHNLRRSSSPKLLKFPGCYCSFRRQWEKDNSWYAYIYSFNSILCLYKSPKPATVFRLITFLFICRLAGTPGKRQQFGQRGPFSFPVPRYEALRSGVSKGKMTARVAKRGPPAGRQLELLQAVSTYALKDAIFQKITVYFKTGYLRNRFWKPPHYLNSVLHK